MTAREKFKVGMRVMAIWPNSLLSIWSRAAKRTLRGKVVGFDKHWENCVRVKRDGIKTISTWHMDFWEPERK